MLFEDYSVRVSSWFGGEFLRACVDFTSVIQQYDLNILMIFRVKVANVFARRITVENKISFAPKVLFLKLF